MIMLRSKKDALANVQNRNGALRRMLTKEWNIVLQMSKKILPSLTWATEGPVEYFMIITQSHTKQVPGRPGPRNWPQS